jgi:hypothetical protein
LKCSFCFPIVFEKALTYFNVCFGVIVSLPFLSSTESKYASNRTYAATSNDFKTRKPRRAAYQQKDHHVGERQITALQDASGLVILHDAQEGDCSSRVPELGNEVQQE